MEIIRSLRLVGRNNSESTGEELMSSGGQEVVDNI